MRRMAPVVGVMIACVALAACGSSSSTKTASSSGGSGSGKTVHIAYLLATEAAGYPLGMKAAAQQVAAQNHAQIQFFDAQFNPATQVSQCEDAITSGHFQAIVALPAASPPMVVCARAAQQHHIPLIATNTPIGDNLSSLAPTVPGVTSQVLVPATTYFGTAPTDAAPQLLPAMCKAAPGRTCRMAVIIGNPALALTVPVKQTMSALAAKYHWQIVGYCTGNYQREGGASCMQDFLQKDPHLNAVFSLSDDMAQGATQVLERAGKVPGKDVMIGTQGGSYQGVPMIRSGKWFGTMLTLAGPEGAIPVKLAAEAAAGQKVPSGVNSTQAGGMPLVLDQLNKTKYPSFKGYFNA